MVTKGMQGMTACEANTRDAMANRLGLKRVGYAFGAAVETRCPDKAMGGEGGPGEITS